jgi:hypothetical protein
MEYATTRSLERVAAARAERLCKLFRDHSVFPESPDLPREIMMSEMRLCNCFDEHADQGFEQSTFFLRQVHQNCCVAGFAVAHS